MTLTETNPPPDKNTTNTVRRTVPMGAYFVLTAIVAFLFALIRLSFGEDTFWRLNELFDHTIVGIIAGSVIGAIMGVFDLPRRRGFFLGAVAGAMIGAAVSACFFIPLEKISLAIHLANASALIIIAFAISVRWNR